MKPNDPYIVDFISDINRARVLRVRSVMTKTEEAPEEAAGEVDHDATLESLISRSNGETDRTYIVNRDGKQIGLITMAELFKALVPIEASDDGIRSSAA